MLARDVTDGDVVPTGAAARKKFGMMLLGIVVFLWVSSNFLTYVRLPYPLALVPALIY